jgi:DNA polymerase-3 subunit beta
MIFNILRDDLLEALQGVQYSSDTRGSMPVLSGVKIEAGSGRITLRTTNLETFSVKGCPANVEDEGETVVNHKLFLEFIRDTSEETLSATLENNELVVKGSNCEYRFHTMPSEDFPQTPGIDTPVLEGMESSEFISAASKVVKAASRDEKRPVLTGALLDITENALRLVSTDSYRLAVAVVDGEFKKKESFIVPAAALGNLNRIADKSGKIGMFSDESRGQVRFRVDDMDYIIRLIEGKFPKYEQFIPEEIPNKLVVEKEKILKAIKRVSIVGTTLKLKPGKEKLEITSESRDVGEGREEIDAEYDGVDMEIAFNAKFLEDGISSVEGEKVLIGMTEPLKPGIVREVDGERYLYIIMPIRL